MKCPRCNDSRVDIEAPGFQPCPVCGDLIADRFREVDHYIVSWFFWLIVFAVLCLVLTRCAPDVNEILVGKKCRLKVTAAEAERICKSYRPEESVEVGVEVLSCQK